MSTICRNQIAFSQVFGTDKPGEAWVGYPHILDSLSASFPGEISICIPAVLIYSPRLSVPRQFLPTCTVFYLSDVDVSKFPSQNISSLPTTTKLASGLLDSPWNIPFFGIPVMDSPWAKSPEEILQHFNVDAIRGLSSDQAAKHAELYGRNGKYPSMAISLLSYIFHILQNFLKTRLPRSGN